LIFPGKLEIAVKIDMEGEEQNAKIQSIYK
jgi:hypothetical protein